MFNFLFPTYLTVMRSGMVSHDTMNIKFEIRIRIAGYCLKLASLFQSQFLYSEYNKLTVINPINPELADELFISNEISS